MKYTDKYSLWLNIKCGELYIDKYKDILLITNKKDPEIYIWNIEGIFFYSGKKCIGYDAYHCTLIENNCIKI